MRAGDGRARVGLIGFGLGGGWLHAPVIAGVERLELAAVVTSRGDEVRARFPRAAVHASADALLADPDIDIVAVVTPHDTHAGYARAALEAGKHVVVDKPFVADPEEGADLIRLARARGRVLSVYQNRRWDGDFLTARGVLAGGRLGALRLAAMHWDRFRPSLRDSWKEDPAHGGGILADLGSHLIDQALLLFGMPDAIAADSAMQREGSRIDDYMDLTLFYGDTRVRLAGSTVVAAARARFELHGTGGSWVKHGIDPQEDMLRAGMAADAVGFGEEPAAAWGTLTDGEGRAERVPTAAGRWCGFYEGLAAAVLDGAAAPVDPVDSLAGLRLIALARRSTAEGRVLAVDAAALRAV